MTAPARDRSGRTDSKLPMRVSRAAEYVRLRRKSANPDSEYPATIEALAGFVPCARRLLYKSDAKTAQIRRVLKKAATPRGSPSMAPPDRDASHVPAVALEAQVERALAKVTTAARRWLDARRHDAGPHAAALAAGDLDHMIRGLLAAQAELRPLVIETQRRQHASRVAASGGIVQESTPEQVSLL